MLLTSKNGQRVTKIDVDGVTVTTPEEQFYPWGGADGAAKTAEEKATAAEAAATAAAEAAAEAAATADNALEAASNAVQKTLQEGQFKQEIEGALSGIQDGKEVWHIGRNSSDNTSFITVDTQDATNGKDMRARMQISHSTSSNEISIYARHGANNSADMVEANLRASGTAAKVILTNNKNGTKIEINDTLKAVMKNGSETRTLDLWALAGGN